MEPIDLRDFYSGGYFLLHPGRPDWPPPFGELLPRGNLISLSNCICRRRFSVLWGWIPGNRQAAVDFGIPETRLDHALKWSSHDYVEAMARNSAFYSPDHARAFVRRFDIDTADLYLIGAALPKYLQKAWIEEEADMEGIAGRIKQGISVDPSGTPLGYDVVSYSYSDFAHSWLCSGLEHDMHKLFGIRTNALGLLDSFADAKQINDWIAEDEGQGRRAEPEAYDFWLLLSYPLTE